MLKVLHVIVGLNVGGAELMLKRLIESQKKLPGYVHSVISLTDPGVIGPQLISQGISVRCLGMKGLLGLPKAFFCLLTEMRKFRPDIVQTWMYHADFLGGLAARLAGVRSVIWGVRTTDLERGGKSVTRLIRKLCAYLSRSVPTKIICAAEASRKAHIAVGYNAQRMLVIPNGFDLSRLNATEEERGVLRASLSLSEEHLVIGSLGRFNPVKDQANFIAATAMLAESNPALRFLMVGRGLTPDNMALTELLSDTGYADRYILLGERGDAPVCLSAMDIFCLHSKTEGFPNVLGEAMAMGVPSVVTDVGDAALLLGGNGIVVPAQDARALALGLKQMIDFSPEVRRLLSESAKTRIVEEFTMEQSSQKFRQLYEDLSMQV
ncbi:glycosyltransferase [Pseudomonas taiwanensis]|uniref:glycosyltransferase family 4 protein n=1 Tax=Pseudomonas taiwanensis TaxID=470150 RepID=UPI0028DD6109|nr:glycosyltransferase [Pseudomonas taiwanensis]MDT8922059.1 glycosyltransferase [Pseudomonas taiwanensis]